VHFDPYLALAGLLVGFTVGLTGMGGGALMTPILVLFFRVAPLAAVSSDLLAAVIMKPIGAGVHLRRGTVNTEMVRWLMLGSVPSAFAGVLVLKALGGGESVENVIKTALGVALVLAATTLVARAVLGVRRTAMSQRGTQAPPLHVRPLATVAVGVVGGLLVGMTSVGSGSLIIVLLLFLYPTVRPSQLVGTDLLQAIPLVASAALGHMLFGDLKLGLTASLLVGSIPGVYIGARISTRAPGKVVRPALALVLAASGLKLLEVGNVQLGILLVGAVLLGPAAWALVRATGGLRFLPRSQPSAFPS